MQLTDAAASWIKAAPTEALKGKLEEYSPKATDKPRDVEYRTVLLSAVRAELAQRGELSN